MKKELKNSCLKCGAKSGVRCRNTKTGDVKSQVHDVRLKAATKKKKNATAKPAAPAMTPEQKRIGEMIEERIQQILGPDHAARFVAPVTAGPVITTYRFAPGRRTRVAQLEALAKDFAVLLGAESVLVKRMTGETNVGVFVPNKDRKIILFRDTITHVEEYVKKKTADGHKPLPLMLGQDADGYPFIDDLTMQPHMLIAGTTGGGKSTLLHGIATALAWVMSSSEIKLIISDTKGVEFTHFKELPHLQFPIATSVFQTMEQLKWAMEETQQRMNLIGRLGVRNIHDYNRISVTSMPYVVIIIDELADLMGTAVDKDVAKAASGMLQTIVQRARTSGIHVVAGTQRPDVKTVAGAIKANFPTRLTFRLPSGQDSRTVINTKGAENLMSRGDMLYSSAMSPELKRLHAPYSSIEDVKAAVSFIIHRERTSNLQNPKANDTAIPDPISGRIN